MIKKIISGGQTGADRAALDVAIYFKIPHGGWIPKGRKTEDGPLSEKYQLQEMSTGSYPKRTEQNVIDSDGTVILSHGPLKGGSKLTQKLAHQHNKPCLHIDLNEIPDFNAVFLVRKWMYKNDVEVLNVAGSRASKDPEIYKRVFDIIKGVFWTDRIKGQNSDEPGELPGKVNTVDEAVDRILVEFPLRDQVETANITEEDLAILQAVLAKYISDKLNEWTVSRKLYEDCQEKADGELLDEADAATVILRDLWNRLRETHRLRVAK
jgi:hypothetical protein